MMSWEQALADPHLMRLGDWLARQLGEREMAKLEAEGESKEDLEKQHLWGDYRAERLKVVMVKEPSSSRFRPFVQVWVSKAESHAACPMSRGVATEVKTEIKEEVKPEIKEEVKPEIPGTQENDEKETRYRTPKQKKRKGDQTNLENIFKWKCKQTNNKEKEENIGDDDQETDQKSIKQKKKKEKKVKPEIKEEITPAIIKLLRRSYKGSKVKKDKVFGTEKEESNHSSSAWRGPRPAPFEVQQARRARPADKEMKEGKEDLQATTFGFNLRGGAGESMEEQIMEGVRRAQLPLRLDTITLGDGNCFSRAVWSQCQRDDVAPVLHDTFSTYIDLKYKLHNFIMKTGLAVVRDMKERYERDVQPAGSEEIGGKEETWGDYWQRMLQNQQWSDGIYIQGMAWFLQMDIILVMSTASPDKPYITISGSWDGPGRPTHGGPLILGYQGVHYQSLVPTQYIHTRSYTPRTVEETIFDE